MNQVSFIALVLFLIVLEAGFAEHQNPPSQRPRFENEEGRRKEGLPQFPKLPGGEEVPIVFKPPHKGDRLYEIYPRDGYEENGEKSGGNYFLNAKNKESWGGLALFHPPNGKLTDVKMDPEWKQTEEGYSLKLKTYTMGKTGNRVLNDEIEWIKTKDPKMPFIVRASVIDGKDLAEKLVFQMWDATRRPLTRGEVFRSSM